MVISYCSHMVSLFELSIHLMDCTNQFLLSMESNLAKAMDDETRYQEAVGKQDFTASV